MGYGRPTPETASTPGISSSSLFSARIRNRTELSKEKIVDLFVYHEALAIGRDFQEATGRIPSYNDFELLYVNGYFNYDPSQIERVFGEWEIFKGDLEIETEDYKQEQEAKKAELLQIIELDLRIGAISPLLLKKIASGKSEEKRTQEKLNKTKKNNDLRILTDEDESSEEQIRRYFLYKVIEKLTPRLDSEAAEREKRGLVSPLSRRTSIVLGFNIETGKLRSSLAGELQKTNESLGTVDDTHGHIERIIDENGWLDYVYPNLRKDYLRELKVITESQQQQFPEPEKSYFSLRTQRVLGGMAIDGYLSSGAMSENIFPLGKVLTEEKIARNGASTKEKNFDGWSHSEYVKYGKWLLSVIKPFGHEHLSQSLIVNAYRLGLGPSRDAITKPRRFGNLTTFNKEVLPEIDHGSIPTARIYDDWEFDDYVEHIRRVAAENNGKVTRPLLWKRIKEGAQEPSPGIISQNVGYTKVLEAAGLKVKTKKVDADHCVAQGLAFLKNENRLPTKADADKGLFSVSYFTLAKYCGGIPNFHKLIQLKLDGESA